MFKAAFPWATNTEEKAEKEYLKSLETISTEEVAGNIWVSEATGKDERPYPGSLFANMPSSRIGRGL